MKRCKQCEVEKPLVDFYANRLMRDGVLSFCKACVRDRYGPSRSVRAARQRDWFQKLKVERGCADCGFNAHPAALDFDHLPGTVKLFKPCTMANISMRAALEEIAKCEVVCANCHRIRTDQRRQALKGVTQL